MNGSFASGQISNFNFDIFSTTHGNNQEPDARSVFGKTLPKTSSSRQICVQFKEDVNGFHPQNDKMFTAILQNE